jgi:capsular polysaccharide biosynthesis protein
MLGAAFFGTAEGTGPGEAPTRSPSLMPMHSTDLPGMVPPARIEPGARRTVVLGLIGAVLLGLMAAGLSAVQGPSYRSEALVVVVPGQGEPTGDAIPIAAVWGQAASTEALLGQVAGPLGLSAEALSDATTVTAVASAPLLSVVVVSDDAAEAAAWANAVAQAVVRQSARTPLSGYTLQLLTTAVPAAQPSGGLSVPMLMAAALIGALGGVSLAQFLARRRRA